MKKKDPYITTSLPQSAKYRVDKVKAELEQQGYEVRKGELWTAATKLLLKIVESGGEIEP